MADLFNQRHPGAQSIDDQSVYGTKIIVDNVVERVFHQSEGRIGAQFRPIAYDLPASDATRVEARVRQLAAVRKLGPKDTRDPVEVVDLQGGGPVECRPLCLVLVVWPIGQSKREAAGLLQIL